MRPAEQEVRILIIKEERRTDFQCMQVSPALSILRDRGIRILFHVVVSTILVDIVRHGKYLRLRGTVREDLVEDAVGVGDGLRIGNRHFVRSVNMSAIDIFRRLLDGGLAVDVRAVNREDEVVDLEDAVLIVLAVNRRLRVHLAAVELQGNAILPGNGSHFVPVHVLGAGSRGEHGRHT